MIKSFKHKELKNLFEKDDPSGLNTTHIQKIKKRLLVIDKAKTIQDINLPGFRLHPLKGDMKNLWAVDVSQNYRITFEFKDGDACNVNIEDYH